MQELVRRAPGTYNHSINVASIAEAAADAIGANGLLVRVGAYFHDIGKMLKPSYFVENQGPEGNRHESLQPAMSTLVIIAHVKDGADLARQHHLPQSIIDFIEQHHGTTLVEYFYRREAQRLKDDPDAGEVDETTFRYPGPKPQTKEAGVLMLADVVESASRALVDPTPARIESLVHDLAMKRLLDGQFDECGLTLSELHTIEDSPRQKPHRRLSRPREVSRASDGLGLLVAVPRHMSGSAPVANPAPSSCRLRLRPLQSTLASDGPDAALDKLRSYLRATKKISRALRSAENAPAAEAGPAALRERSDRWAVGSPADKTGRRPDRGLPRSRVCACSAKVKFAKAGCICGPSATKPKRQSCSARLKRPMKL